MHRVFQAILDAVLLLPISLLPHHWLSRQVHAFTRSAFSSRLIRPFCRYLNIDLSLAVEPDPSHYPTFNQFFTRALKPEVRPVDSDPTVLVSPVDGRTSQYGTICIDTLFQAKGKQFSLNALLGGLETRATPFIDGMFSTIYLSPRDYHRIHMPIEGTLREMIYIPGRLYPVNTPSTRTVPGLFSRNERVVALFDTPAGPMALVLVGALFVGSIETVWAGEITPPQKGFVHCWHYRDDEQPIRLEKGEEMGRFNMGSTVIMLFGKDQIDLDISMSQSSPLQMGAPIGSVHT